jgi:hypothetical protein
MDMSLHSFPFKTIKSISLESTLPIEQLSLDLISSVILFKEKLICLHSRLFPPKFSMVHQLKTITTFLVLDISIQLGGKHGS